MLFSAECNAWLVGIASIKMLSEGVFFLGIVISVLLFCVSYYFMNDRLT